MRSPKKTTAVVLAGAVALGSVAYGLGSQTGDGSAAARGDAARSGDWGPGPGAGFDDLAETLGVDVDELGSALRDFHDQKMTERRAALATALAEALGKSREDVEQALTRRHEAEHARVAKRLADELGLDADKVEAALEKVMDADREDGEHGPGAFFDDLAAELGVSADAIEEAFREAGPRRREGRHRGPELSGLAAALDVSRAELRRALRSIRSGEHADRNPSDELAAFLAERFDLDQSKVEDALDELPGPHWGGPHPGGPGWGGPHLGGPGPVGPPPPGF